ncbi:MAG: hypothetical protein HC852_06970 [Acaryochloridaceae cyanobacterium RU_4_10]|nr:hypothetical protein [Acaryochloridaceae cyanobacterium RU_4_10]
MVVNTSVEQSQQAIIQGKQSQTITPLFGSPTVQHKTDGTVAIELSPKAAYLYQIQ